MHEKPILNRSEIETGPCVLVGDAAVTDLTMLLAEAPWLADADEVVALARFANHLAHGYDFSVIEDPAAFKIDYEARIAAEEASGEAYPGMPRLSDYGVPDFKKIDVPQQRDESLRFYAAQSVLGLAFEATVDLHTGTAEYVAMDLT